MNLPPEQHHAFQWNDRLQDWLDGDLAPDEAAEVEQHIAGCAQCRAHWRELQRLDAALTTAAPPLALNAAFDQRVFAQIEADHDARRAALRAQVEAELRENMRALTRSWRRTLLFVLPGVLAGLAVAFALASSVFSIDLTQSLITDAERLTQADSVWVETAVLALIGALFGGGIARWLASVAD